jgi:uncharacterized membrane protein YedE/YeeE
MIFEDFGSAHTTVLWIILGISFVMGAVVNKTNFCTMGAVSDMVNIGDFGRFRAWLLAITVAMIGVTILEASGVSSMDKTLPPYRGSNFAWLEYVLGGIMFGVGMTYGSGCGNKTLVRIGGGNLKSVLVFAIIALMAYYMLNPFPGTDKTIYSVIFYGWTSKASISMASQQDLGSIIAGFTGGSAGMTRVIVGLIVAAALLFYILKSSEFRSSLDNVLAGIVVGLGVFAAWYFTSGFVTVNADGEMLNWAQYASAESWDMLEDNAAARPRDVGVQSFTFINPIGQTLRYVIQDFSSSYVTFGLMAVMGVILGSFFWAIVSKGFRIEWFLNAKDMLNHVIGAVLMGLGGVLALGCTVGQGISGISTLASGSFLAFGGILLGSAMTMKIQYYKLVYEEEATFMKSFLSAMADLKLLPNGMRKLEAV